MICAACKIFRDILIIFIMKLYHSTTNNVFSLVQICFDNTVIHPFHPVINQIYTAFKNYFCRCLCKEQNYLLVIWMYVFPIPLTVIMPITYQQFTRKWSFGRNFQTLTKLFMQIKDLVEVWEFLPKFNFLVNCW